MNSELIALIIFVASLSGLWVLLSRKIEELIALPEPVGIFLKEETKEKIREKAKEVLKERSSSFEKFLQKMLSKTRILSMRTEKKLSDWAMKLRERSQERTKDIDSYWKEIKASVKKKDKKK